jgi:hypothetical protein
MPSVLMKYMTKLAMFGNGSMNGMIVGITAPHLTTAQPVLKQGILN